VGLAVGLALASEILPSTDPPFSEDDTSALFASGFALLLPLRADTTTPRVIAVTTTTTNSANASTQTVRLSTRTRSPNEVSSDRSPLVQSSSSENSIDCSKSQSTPSPDSVQRIALGGRTDQRRLRFEKNEWLHL
jgi:hypothetical protein